MTELSKKLTPLDEPVKDNLPGKYSLGTMFVVGVAGLALTMILPMLISKENFLGIILGAVIPMSLALLVVIVMGLMNQASRGNLYTESMEAYREEYAAWNASYCCMRDDLIFIPEE